MAEFKVFKSKVEVLTHSNADSLELLKIGHYQCVVQKGLYKTGDVVIFAPEKSILPLELQDPFKNYLVGENKDRVKSVRLRGEISMGVILPLDFVDPNNNLPFDIDISNELNIKKYEPPIPSNLSGITIRLKDLSYYRRHDCEQFSLYADEFLLDERVFLTEKIHGSQCVFIKHLDNSIQLSSKGLFKNNVCLKETKENTYWQAVHNDNLINKIQTYFPDEEVLVFGEVVPIQKGFNYGATKLKPTLYIFRIIVNGEELSLEDILMSFPDIQTVPLLSIRLFNKEDIIKFGKELKQSDLDTHIAEGIVVSPSIPRKAKDGTDLYLKIVSNKYAKVEDIEALS
jgi:RNA ligase (TIGR02306 family)